MIESEIAEVLAGVFDGGLLHHGFTDYLRDYFFEVDLRGPEGSAADGPQGTRLLFKNCVHADVRTVVDAAVWLKSMDDALLEPSPGVPGYVCGIRSQLAYPGLRLVEPSPEAADWSQRLGIGFHEVMFEGNAHQISLVFSGLETSPWDPAVATGAGRRDAATGDRVRRVRPAGRRPRHRPATSRPAR